MYIDYSTTLSRLARSGYRVGLMSLSEITDDSDNIFDFYYSHRNLIDLHVYSRREVSLSEYAQSLESCDLCNYINF